MLLLPLTLIPLSNAMYFYITVMFSGELQCFQLQLIIVLQIFMQLCQRLPDFLNLSEVKVAERSTCIYWYSRSFEFSAEIDQQLNFGDADA